MSDSTLDISTNLDLEKIIIKNEIHSDITIRGEHIKELDKVEKINGSLRLVDSIIESFGILKEVKGSMYVSSWTITTGNFNFLFNSLEFVGGDLILRYTNIEDLGVLKKVGGKLSLRDTKVENLGVLEFVGGDLFLPIRMKNKIDFTNLTVKGNVKYWGDVKTEEKIETVDNETLNTLINNKKYHSIHNLLINNKISSPSFGLIHTVEFNCKKRVISSKFLFDNLVNKSNISDLYVRKNFDEYIVYCEKEIERIYGDNFSFFYSLFNKNKSYQEIINEFPQDFPKWTDHRDNFGGKNGVRKIFDTHHLKSENSKFYKRIERKYGPGQTNWLSTLYNSIFDFDHHKIMSFSSFLERIILKILSSIVINNTGNFRKYKGVPLSGEGWVSETDLYNKIKNHYSTLKVIQHGKPKWLKRQHVDIWLSEYKVGIEFHGEQHFRPIDFFGGEKVFKKTIERDKRKIELFRKNNSSLIIVKDGYIFSDLISKIDFIINNTKKIKVKDHIISPKIKVNYQIVDIDDTIFDCKELKNIKIEDMNQILNKNLYLSVFKRSKSIDGRFILEKNKNNSSILSNWKTILDKSTNSTERHNLKSFSEKLNVKQNNVWGFFNGKQKVFRGKFIVVETN